MSPGTTLGGFKTVASQVAVRVGDVVIHPGDFIVGDVDGVVAVPKDKVAEVLAMAHKIDASEMEQARLIIAEKSLHSTTARPRAAGTR